MERNHPMIFLSFEFYLAVIALLVVYYCFPPRLRWTVLLTASLGGYIFLAGEGSILLGMNIAVSFLMGHALKGLQDRQNGTGIRRLCLGLGILVVVMPLFLAKEGTYLAERLLHHEGISFWSALGLAYFTLQTIGYMVDVYRGEILPEKNLAKYALFVSFFPQIVQGPIARYGRLSPQFFGEVRFDERKFSKGLQWLLWGFFLKLMIADRAGVIVNRVFDNWEIYTGGYVLLAGVLYSLQLYADFSACVYLAKGVAGLFGIELEDNFRQPYFSRSVKEFWGRWHITLSSWLKDYIYIPLGGNRKGKLRKWLNLCIVFAVSGMWHGAGLKYVFWGLMHAAYQIAGELTAPVRRRIYRVLRIEENDLPAVVVQRVMTFFWVMLAWIIFRAESLRAGLQMLRNLFTVYNLWIFWNDSIYTLGLDIKECMLLFLTVLFLFAVSRRQEKMAGTVGEWLLDQHLLTRWTVYLGAVLLIVVFGTYGYGFDAFDFIYGGF